MYIGQGNLSISHSEFVNSGSIISFNNENLSLVQNTFRRTTPDMTNPAVYLETDYSMQDPVTIVNNTFINWGTAIDVPSFWGNGVITLMNNIFYFDDDNFDNSSSVVLNNAARPNGIDYTPAASDLNYNLMYGYENLGFQGIHNEYWTNGRIFDDPLFVDKSQEDYRLTALSPALDTGNPDSDDDNIDFDGLDNILGNTDDDQDDQDPDGTRLDLGAIYCPQTTLSSSSTISSNEEWYGIYSVDASVTITNGATLTLVPGSLLQFPDLTSGYVYFNVYGNLVADGTPEAPITFTSSDANPAKSDWYGIRIFSTSNPNITVVDNCIIEYGRYGIYIDGTSPDITNNISRYNYFGFYARSNSPDVTSNQFVFNTYGTYNNVSSPVYTNNLISENSYRGMYHFGSSTPQMYNNTIEDNYGIGVYIYNHADVQFGNATSNDAGFNEIINNNSYGIYANYYSDPFLGTSDPYNDQVAGSNSIHDNITYNLRAYNHSIVEAEWNWWEGETAFYNDATSSLDYSPVLGSEPNTSSLGSSLAKSSSSDGYVDCLDYDFFNPDTSSECGLWHWAHDLRITNQLPVALWAWQLFADKFPEADKAPGALVKLANFTPEEDQEDLIPYFVDVMTRTTSTDDLRIKALELLIGVYAKRSEYAEAYTNARILLEQALNQDQELIALFSLIDFNQNGLGKATVARGYLAELKEKYPNYELTLMAAELMGEDVDWSQVVLGEEVGEEPEASVLPEHFALHPAYPNPFNPITSIRYDLSKDTPVQLNIYDITGRLVQTLVAGRQVGGFYEVQWDGRDANGISLPSGLYLYRLQAGSFVANEKMLLLK